MYRVNKTNGELIPLDPEVGDEGKIVIPINPTESEISGYPDGAIWFEIEEE